MMAEVFDLDRVYAAIDSANACDPACVEIDGTLRPAALVYGERMSARLAAYAPDASLELKIAARGQHIERWFIPRKSYAEGRIGYLSWRKELQRLHARRLAEIGRECGLHDSAIERIGQIVRKERLVSDADVQTIEDVACLVFLEHYFDPFAATQSDAKLADIVAKTWRKMSQRARDTVLATSPPQRIVDLLNAGLAGGGDSQSPPPSR